MRCPECGRELTLPKPAAFDDLFLISEPTVTSGNAIASLVLGACLFLGCLSGLPAIWLGRKALADIALGAGRVRGRGMAIAGIVLGFVSCLATVPFVLPIFSSARVQTLRGACTNNLKQVGRGMHVYHEMNGSLPAAAITDKNGRPLLSWRVAILPYIDAGGLYAKFHLDEPWDSPHNYSLLAEMPSIYACPSDREPKPGMTGYQVVVGSRTAFRSDFKPVHFEDITDGVSHTILIGESRRVVPWTKPEDLPFGMNGPLSGLGSHHGDHNNGFNVVFADNSVRFLDTSIKSRDIEAMLTRDGSDMSGPQSYYEWGPHNTSRGFPYRGQAVEISCHERQGHGKPGGGSLFLPGLFEWCAGDLAGAAPRLSDIRASGGRIRGRVTAIVGIALGVFGCLFTLAYVLPGQPTTVRSRAGAVREQPQADRTRDDGIPSSERMPARRRDHRQERQTALELASGDSSVHKDDALREIPSR